MTRRSWGTCALVLLGLIGVAAPGRAQELFANNESAPDVTRYTRPAQCVAAASRIGGITSWGQDTDSLSHQESAVRLAPMRETARSCGRKFLPAGVTAQSLPERDLDALFSIALLMEQVPLSEAILARRLGLRRTKADSGDVLFDAVVAYATAHPAQLGAARSAAAAYDRSGNTGDVVTGWWMSPHELVIRAAVAHFDTLAIRAEGRAMLANVKALPQAERDAGVHEAGRAAVLALMIENLPALAGGQVDSGVTRFKAGVAALFGPEFMTQPPPHSIFMTVAHLGQRIDSLPGDYWIGLPPGESVRPRKGKVTLVWSINQHCWACGSDFATLRSLKRRFGAAIDIVLLASTNGYLRDLPPMEPQEESKMLGSLYLDFHRVSGALGVTRTPFTKRPEPDRRRVNDPTPGFDRYSYPLPVLIDPDGRLAVQVPMPLGASGETLAEPLMQWIIASMLARSAPSP